MKPYEMRGEIIDAGKCEEFGAKAFKKRTILVADGNEKYPKTIPFELTKDAAEKAPPLGMATIKFYLDAREWQGRHFVSLRVAEIIHDDAAPMPAPVAPPPGQPPVPASVGDDDLPF